MNQPPVIHAGERLPLLDGTNDHLMFSREFWNKVIASATAFLNLNGLRVTANNSFIETGTSAGGAGIAGEYDPAKSYGKNIIVFFTPDGDFARTFYTLQPVPAGVSPDTGFPFWAAFPIGTPGVWG